MGTRRNFIVSLSLGSLASAVAGRPTAAQSNAGGVRLVVDEVYDLGILPDLDPGEIRQLSDVVSQHLGRQLLEENLSESGNCGCNAVCTCNNNTDSCCENKCACHSKSSLDFNFDEVTTTPIYESIIGGFNPEQVTTFREAMIGVLQLPQYGGLGVGVDDTGAPLAPGTYSPEELRGNVFPPESVEGAPISDQFILQQFRKER